MQGAWSHACVHIMVESPLLQCSCFCPWSVLQQFTQVLVSLLCLWLTLFSLCSEITWQSVTQEQTHSTLQLYKKTQLTWQSVTQEQTHSALQLYRKTQLY